MLRFVACDRRRPLVRRQLLDRLQGDLSPHERNEIERLLEQIDTALNLLDETVPETSDEQWLALPHISAAAPYSPN
jgi:hypothetical protein